MPQTDVHETEGPDGGKVCVCVCVCVCLSVCLSLSLSLSVCLSVSLSLSLSVCFGSVYQLAKLLSIYILLMLLFSVFVTCSLRMNDPLVFCSIAL